MTVADEGLRERIREAITNQKRPTVTVLSSLLAAQDEIGYLPEQAIEEVAVLNDTTINDVWGVASFYKNFRFSPPGDHVVEVCWGPTCHLVGAPKVLQRALEHLGLEGDGETPDKKITFRYNTCLGACSQAPVMSIDHHLYGRITPDKAVGLIEQAKKTPRKQH